MDEICAADSQGIIIMIYINYQNVLIMIFEI